MRLAVGAGWIEAEFRALSVSRARRGRDTDATLAEHVLSALPA